MHQSVSHPDFMMFCSDTTRLLCFVFKAHAICSSVAEAKALLDQMIEENRVALVEVKDKLDCLQRAKENSNDRGDRATVQEKLGLIREK